MFKASVSAVATRRVSSVGGKDASPCIPACHPISNQSALFVPSSEHKTAEIERIANSGAGADLCFEGAFLQRRASTSMVH